MKDENFNDHENINNGQWLNVDYMYIVKRCLSMKGDVSTD